MAISLPFLSFPPPSLAVFSASTMKHCSAFKLFLRIADVDHVTSQNVLNKVTVVFSLRRRSRPAVPSASRPLPGPQAVGVEPGVWLRWGRWRSLGALTRGTPAPGARGCLAQQRGEGSPRRLLAGAAVFKQAWALLSFAKSLAFSWVQKRAAWRLCPNVSWGREVHAITGSGSDFLT